MLLFAVVDVLAKMLVEAHSLAAIFLFRSVAPAIVLVGMVLHRGIQTFREADSVAKQVARALLTLLEVSLFYLAIRYMPLGEALTYYLASPIYIILLSSFLLKETLDRTALLAAAIGFAGVVLIFGSSFSSSGLAALLPTASSFCFALVVIMTRSMRRTSNLVFVVYQFGTAMAFGALMHLGNPQVPGGLDFSIMTMIGLLSLGGFALLNFALRLTSAAVIAPYQYTIVLWGLILAFLVFGEVPAPLSLLGAATIAVTGLYFFIRQLHQAARSTAAAKLGATATENATS